MDLCNPPAPLLSRFTRGEFSRAGLMFERERTRMKSCTRPVFTNEAPANTNNLNIFSIREAPRPRERTHLLFWKQITQTHTEVRISLGEDNKRGITCVSMTTTLASSRHCSNWWNVPLIKINCRPSQTVIRVYSCVPINTCAAVPLGRYCTRLSC